MTTLIFILILSFLVLIHELGHFLTAKKFGIKVEEFGMGYPPKALRLHKDKSGTEYTLNWLPFGGFVRMFGEDGPEGERGETQKRETQKNAKESAFYTKPVWQRMIVIVAGVVTNFIFGVIAFAAIYTHIGIPTSLEGARIERVAADSPAAVADLQSGDLVTQVSGESFSLPVANSGAFIQALQQASGETVTLSFQRAEQELTAEVYVRTPEEIPADQGTIGVTINDFELRRFPMWQMPIRGAVVGMQSAIEFGSLLLSALGNMFRDLLTMGKVPSELAGPVGIVHMAQREGVLTSGWIDRLNFAAILSINLAIVNLLPFPSLDGGRFVFLLYEGIRRKRINPKVEQYANLVGFGLLILMIVAVSVRDVGRIIQDTAVQEWFKDAVHE